MAVDRTAVVDENLLKLLASWKVPSNLREGDPTAPLRPGTSLTGRTAIELMESQFIARHLDIEARALKRRNEGFYTIGSAGHEGNVVLGRLLGAKDPTFLHYRSGALMAERSRHVNGSTPIFDVLLSLVASKEDPCSGGRHKVFGSRRLWVPPQTSTIASHLPKAMGCAFALDRAWNRDIPVDVPRDSIVSCTFGDATVNHATAQAAFNSAAWASFQNLPLPLLFVCEDNHIGISVRTPENWVMRRFENMPGISYFLGDGLSLGSAWNAASAAVDYVRRKRRPAFLHLEVVRLLGHAGSDVETEYRQREEIEASEALDPLLQTTRLILDAGLLKPEQIRDLYEEIRERVQAAAREVVSRPRLTTKEEVVEALLPIDPVATEEETRRIPELSARLALFGRESNLPERSDRPRHLAFQLNRALQDALALHPEMILFGEDVGRKGGVYHVTTDLTRKVGVGRVFNTLLDETSILGLAMGAAQIGLLPVPEIQYLAYLHNAEDQLRGEACSLQFFSNNQFRNPMVVRIAAFGYQKGFGGHFHNDSSIAVLRDMPGLIIAAPARPDDAVRVFRTCLALAKVNGSVVVFLEPIALYMTKDLYESGDSEWLAPYPPPGEGAPYGKARVDKEGAGGDLTIITYANGAYLSLRAARTLQQEHGLEARVVDLLWLSPIDEASVLAEAQATGRVLIVDEGRKSGGIGEALSGLLAEKLHDNMPAVSRVCAEDTFTPLGPAANEVLPSEAGIVAAALSLCQYERQGADL